MGSVIANPMIAFLGGFMLVASTSFGSRGVTWIGVIFGVTASVIVLFAQLDPERSILQRGIDTVIGVLSGFCIASGFTGSGPALRWALFAVSLGWVGLSYAGLTVSRDRRMAHGLLAGFNAPCDSQAPILGGVTYVHVPPAPSRRCLDERAAPGRGIVDLVVNVDPGPKG